MDLVNGIPTIDNQEIKQQEINYGKHLENELVEENGLNLARSTSILKEIRKIINKAEENDPKTGKISITKYRIEVSG